MHLAFGKNVILTIVNIHPSFITIVYLFNTTMIRYQWSSNIKIHHYTEATFDLLDPTVVAQSSSCEN